jgi:diguanylate cyclase (GGDEF)-like protein/PAS domain S-box-containing protein
MLPRLASTKMLFGAVNSVLIISFLLVVLAHHYIGYPNTHGNLLTVVGTFMTLAYIVFKFIDSFQLKLLLRLAFLALSVQSAYWLLNEMSHKASIDVVINSLIILFFTLPNILIILRGVRTELQMEERLVESEQQLRMIYESLEVGIWLMDFRTKQLLYVSPGLEKISGLPQRLLIEDGSNWRKLIHPDDVAQVTEGQSKVDGGIAQDFEYRIRRRDGLIRHVKEKVFPVRNDSGQIVRVTGIIIDNSTEVVRAEQMQYMAYHDELTGLYSRRKFGQDLQMGTRLPSSAKMALMYVDLDRFKAINDVYSHSIGDELLKQIAIRLSECINGSGDAYRIGGDEFAILLRHTPDEPAVLTVAERVVSALSKKYVIQDIELSTSCSIGIAIFPDHTVNPELLMKYADGALYEAKTAGKKRCSCFTGEIAKRLTRKAKIERGLRHALGDGQFSLVYQPQVADDGTVVGLEALLRWRTEEGEEIPPSEFIPVAEESGLIVPIGEWALRQACAQNKAWQIKGLKPVKVSINLSVKQFQRGDIVQLIASALQEAGLEGRYLDLEIAEPASLPEGQETLGKLGQLRSLGASVTIDDFGSGSCLLSNLKKFRFDRIKIAKEYVPDREGKAEDQALMRAIISIAQGLNMEVVAEGVETPQQRELLQSLGCRLYQGYLFERPLDAEHVEELLAGRSSSAIIS